MSTFAGDNPYRGPAAAAPEAVRSAFLRQVGLWTFGGLMIATLTSLVSTMAVIAVPALQNQWIAIAVMLGAMFGAQWVGGSMVQAPERSTQITGFVLGTGLQGIAMGYLLLAAVTASMAVHHNPFIFLLQALALVGLTVTGMTAYLITGPKQLSMIGGALSALTLPMLGLMVLSFLVPIGGVFGILISLVFVGVSAAGLLYNLNHVMHHVSTDRTIPAAYHVALGVLILFWNILTLLMRLQRR